MKKRLSKSIRKYIRREKARVRREVLDLEKQKKLIDELYKSFSKKEDKKIKNKQKNENK